MCVKHFRMYWVGIYELVIIDDALGFVKQVFSTDFSGHDYRTRCVCTNGCKNAQEEVQIKRLLPLLRFCMMLMTPSPETAEHKDRAVTFLRQHAVDEAAVQAICTAIDEVSFSGTDRLFLQRLRECAQDADRLDALEPLVSHRAFCFYGGSHGRAMYDLDEPPTLTWAVRVSLHKSTSLNHFYEKFLLADMMNTRSIRKSLREVHAWVCRWILVERWTLTYSFSYID